MDNLNINDFIELLLICHVEIFGGQLTPLIFAFLQLLDFGFQPYFCIPWISPNSLKFAQHIPQIMVYYSPNKTLSQYADAEIRSFRRTVKFFL